MFKTILLNLVKCKTNDEKKVWIRFSYNSEKNKHIQQTSLSAFVVNKFCV